jgi:hypothetical protein
MEQRDSAIKIDETSNTSILIGGAMKALKVMATIDDEGQLTLD